MKANIQTDHGEVVIDTDVIAKYAGAVAVECFGVVGMATTNMMEGISSLRIYRSVVLHVNVKLFVRGRDALGGEDGANRLNQAKVYIPVISGLAVRTANDLDAALARAVQQSHRSRFADHLRVVKAHLYESVSGNVKIGSGSHVEVQVDTAQIQCGVVRDSARGGDAVRHIDNFVVQRDQLGADDLQFFNCSLKSGNFNVITDLERAGDKQQDAAGKVA